MLYFFHYLLCLLRGATVCERKGQGLAWLCLTQRYCPINKTSNLQIQLRGEKLQVFLTDSSTLYKTWVSITYANGQYSLLREFPFQPFWSSTQIIASCLHWQLSLCMPKAAPALMLYWTTVATYGGTNQNKSFILSYWTCLWTFWNSMLVCLCTGIAAKIPPPATWLLVSQQEFRVIGSVQPWCYLSQ